MKQVKKFAQLLCTADFAKELIKQGKFATLREMYYTAEGWEVGPFYEQGESDAIIEDLEAAFGLKREDLGLTPEEDGAAVYGKLVVNEDGVVIDATKAGRAGYTIPPTIDDVEFLKCKAKRVIAVETMGMYHRLVQERAWKKFDALIVGLKGQAARATRRFLKRANEELELPVYLNCDGDPFGFHIAMVIISGSAKLAYINHELAVPDAKFLGLRSIDFDRCGLSDSVKIDLNDTDRKRAKQIAGYPWFAKKRDWQREIKRLLDNGFKLEVEALISKNISYVTEVYTPARLKNRDWLD